jgi:hypothetical protein
MAAFTVRAFDHHREGSGMETLSHIRVTVREARERAAELRHLAALATNVAVREELTDMASHYQALCGASQGAYEGQGVLPLFVG